VNDSAIAQYAKKTIVFVMVSARSKIKGNKETVAAMFNNVNTLQNVGDCGIINDNGIRTIKMAFSCTCQPNKKDPSPVKTRDFINNSLDGCFHN
jgi:hypothetical protein